MNIIINGPHVRSTDAELLFGDEEVKYVDNCDISVLLRDLVLYQSTTKARNAGRVGPIPPGWTERFKATKIQFIWIWNPTE